MDQRQIIEPLYHWLREQPFVTRCRCDHVTSDRESLGLYLGDKVAHRGRTQQIAQADIIVHDDERVQLVIEVDPTLNPKKILGVIFSAIVADNFTPSNETSASAKRLDDTVILYVTVIEEKSGSQKEAQIRAINDALARLIDRVDLGVRIAKVCFGSNMADTIEETKRVVRQELGSTQEGDLTG